MALVFIRPLSRALDFVQGLVLPFDYERPAERDVFVVME